MNTLTFKKVPTKFKIQNLQLEIKMLQEQEK
jgi:hypothetical protein